MKSGLIQVTITCTGSTPLLMNRLTPETLESIRTKAKKSKSASRPETPRDEAAPKVYQTKDGAPYLPTENLLACLIAAGQFVRLDGKRQVSTAKSTVLPAFLTLDDMYIPLLDAPAGKVPAWEVDVRPGRNPNGGEAVCLCRPRFDKWCFTVQASVDLDEVELRIVRELFDIAGKRIGLGDFRPQRKGMFGRFQVVRWDDNPLAIPAE
jgi:hypothetical protein